jgi:phage tail sheath protein FI
MPINLSAYNQPGVFIEENTWGVIPATLSSHSTVYLVGYSPLAGAPKNIPTFCESKDAFTTIFGTNSASSPIIDAWFTQRTGSGIYFINVDTKPSKTITLASVVAATTYTITVNGFAYSVVASAVDTPATVIAALTALVNNGSVSVYIDGLVLKHAATDVVTATNLTLTTVAAPGIPDINDIRQTILRTLDGDLPQGYICAPEFFKRFTLSSELQLLASAIEGLCSDPNFYWIGLLDCSNAVATSTDFVRAAQTERALLSSPKGHTSYYAPYLNTSTGVTVPASIYVAATALRAQRDFGLRQPPASKLYPLRGVTGVTVAITKQAQAVINPLGINAIRFFPNAGYCVYGARTLSTNKFYRFILVRLILNILAGTLENTFDQLVLTGVDGLGTTFANIKGAAVTVVERLRQAGALYGSTPDQAYRVVCDGSNNPSIDLEDGKVAVDVIVVPTATLEVMVVRIARAAIGSTLTETVTGTVNTNTTSVGTPSVTPKV